MRNRILEAYRTGGVQLAADVATHRVADWLCDRRFGTRTGGLVPIETLIEDWEDCHDYFPTSSRTFDKLMSYVTINPGRDSFVDIGSGKGRVLIMAARRPFRRVYGFEISEQLNRTASRNLERCRASLACRDVVIVMGDAAVAAMPDDASVFYLYNPCHGGLLRRIMASIEESAARCPRDITVLFNNIRHYTAMEQDFPSLRPVNRFSLEHDCAVYRILRDDPSLRTAGLPRPPSAAYAADD
jgi:SAM-dependent methyltransferase